MNDQVSKDALGAGATQTPLPADVAAASKARTRKRGFTILAVVVVIGLIAFAIHHFFFAGRFEETDDAYVGGDMVAITSREPATVMAIYADNTESVRKGQRLIDLDPATADVAVAAAEAQLARTVRSVRAQFASVDAGSAEVAQAAAELSRAQNDYSRRKGAAASGAISGEELAHAADTVTTSRAALALTQSRLAQAQTAVQGASIANNPDVLAAATQLRRAAIVQSHMRLAAPVNGVVAQRTVQLGQQVAAGSPLMAVVPLDSLWVDANFRETQLQHIRVGQPVTVKADVYGGDVVYHGKILGLGAGSGSAFALLPAQNASGNWIKITQRVPVRIALDPEELKRNPLRIGLSVKAEVDIRDHSGSFVARQAIGHPAYAQASQDGGPDVEARIASIIAANSHGGKTR